MQAALNLPGLRTDGSLPMEASETPKMVSLDLLLGANSTPATPRDPDLPLPAVDPSDPLVQQLVQDKSFLTAVQTSQLHAAASAAVRLLRSHFAGGEGFRRPADRRLARDPFAEGGLDGTPRGAPGPRAPPGPLVVQRQLVEPRHREALRGMRLEVLDLEDVIPWNSVRRTWKAKRTTWRRQVKQTEVIPDFAARLKELRAALLTEEAPLPGCGATWRAQLEACVQGKGSYGLLSAAWDEMRGTIRSWLEGRGRPAAQTAAQLQAGAVRAVRAMQAALAGAPGGQPDAAALLQVPLEAVVGGDSGPGLAAVRQAIELEKRVLSARLSGDARDAQQAQQQQSDGSGGEGGGAPAPPLASPRGQPLVSYFSSISAAWCDSDFDSGGDSDGGGGDAMDASSATDLDSDYEP